MEEFYMDTAANLLCNIRIRIEGIEQLYEDGAAPLQHLAETNDMLTAVAAFDAIGSALYHEICPHQILKSSNEHRLSLDRHSRQYIQAMSPCYP